MSDNTKIQWTDATWSPVVGCSKVSPGCQNCWAERMAYRLSAIESNRIYKARQIYERKYSLHIVNPDGWTGNIICDESVLDKPLHWKKPRMIFVCSMGDLFHESVPFTFLTKVMAMAEKCKQHTFLLLTKRPERMADCFKDMPPPSNTWLGVTAENQEMADKRIPILLQIPAAVRFVSIEPMLSGINMERFEGKKGKIFQCLKCGWKDDDTKLTGGNLSMNCPKCNARNTLGANHKDELKAIEYYPGLDWVIVGCESGPGARYCQITWIEDIINQCKTAHVPVFVKQIHLNNKAKAIKDIEKFPTGLRIREYPKTNRKVGTENG